MLKLYNTLKRQVLPFKPLTPGQVGLYVCGPTVYGRAHIGNARPVAVIDVLYRLLSRDHKVTYVRNITDIDDKIIMASKERGISIAELTTEMTAHYHKDMGALNVLSPTHEPRATEHIAGMIAMIETLIAHGHAYAKEGHVLFDTPTDPDYGCLSRQPLEDMIAGARVEVAPYKKNAQDFVLWKPSLEDQPGWESPWGRGRPGWHIECSAMSLNLLGKTFDIHGGGQDLIFPHHENEIAQSTCALGKGTFAQTWIHNGMLMVNGAKMSKSLGNFLTVQDLLDQADGETVRLALLSTHYRQPLDWIDGVTLPQAKATLDRFYTALKDAKDLPTKDPSPQVLEALNDDLNTPQALAVLHDLVTQINKCTNASQKTELQSIFKASAELLGLLGKTPIEWFQGAMDDQSLSPEAIEHLIAQRLEFKKNKDFEQADRIRQDLLSKGIALEDSTQGTTWRKI